MIRIELQIDLHYQVGDFGADFLFNVHAAHTRNQVIATENLRLSQACNPVLHTDPATGNRSMRLHAEPGELHLTYSAGVELTHHLADPDSIQEVPVHQLPPAALGYLYPSRYCESDRLLRFAANRFGAMRRGYDRVRAIRDWVNQHVAFTPNSTNSNTSSVTTIVDPVGVCRDFAHLMIALCRALNIPARFVTSTDYGSDPAIGPPDFHAYVEVFLGDRWYIFDPSGLTIPMGLVRFATGRDAADVAFATIFGQVTSMAPRIRAFAVEDRTRGIGLPFHCREALSTADAFDGVMFDQGETG